MAYVLVMGGLALSVSFTLGWVLWRSALGLWGLVAGTAARQPAARKQKETVPSEPWGLTFWFARRYSAPPLAFLAVLLYGVTRLVEFGMTRRPQSPPAGYHDLVNVLGWLAAGLLALALLNLLARWRCGRGQASN